MHSLSPKQKRFVDEYLLDLNSTQAAIRAGYSPKSANSAGPRLLENVDVAAAIISAKLERAKDTGINAARVLEEIAHMAFYDPADLMIDGEPDAGTDAAAVVNGREVYGLRTPADIKRLPAHLRRPIVGWGGDRNQNSTVKLADRSKALDQLARHLALYKDGLKVNGLEGLGDRLIRATARCEKSGET